MIFTMEALTRSLADYLAPHLPGVTFYDSPNQQGTRLPALFLQRTQAKLKGRAGGRFLRELGLDLVCLIDCNQVDMERQYTRVADVLDQRLDTFPYREEPGGACALLRAYGRDWYIRDHALHYKFNLKLWMSRGEEEALMRSIQSCTEEVS